MDKQKCIKNKPWLNILKNLFCQDKENRLKMDNDRKKVFLKDVANCERFLDPTPHQKKANVKLLEFWHRVAPNG